MPAHDAGRKLLAGKRWGAGPQRICSAYIHRPREYIVAQRNDALCTRVERSFGDLAVRCDTHPPPDAISTRQQAGEGYSCAKLIYPAIGRSGTLLENY